MGFLWFGLHCYFYLISFLMVKSGNFIGIIVRILYEYESYRKTFYYRW